MEWNVILAAFMLRVCLVRKLSGMECHGSIPVEWVGFILVFGMSSLKEWNGYILVFSFRDGMEWVCSSLTLVFL